MYKYILIIGLVLGGMFFISCHLKPTIPPTINTTNTATTVQNKNLIDTAIALLKTGQVVLRMGQGADSYLLAQMNQKDKTYSHCGIVIVEDGYPFVYHSIGGEDNPDERMRRDSAKFFFSPLHNFAIAIIHYDFSEQQINNLKNIVYNYYQSRPKFDLKFDLKTDDKLYCAELVYKAINKAVADTGYINTTTLMGCTFVAIDNLFINKHANIIWQTNFK